MRLGFSRSLIPGTLVTRGFIILAIIIVLSQALSYGLIATFAIHPQGERAARVLAKTLGSLQMALEQQSPAERALTIARINQAGQVRILPASQPPHASKTRPSFLEREAADAVVWEFSRSGRSQWMIDDKHLFWFKMKAGNAYYYVSAQEPRSSGPFVGFTILSLVGLFTALAVTGLLALRIQKVLRRLTYAAEQVTLGQRPDPVDLGSSTEMKTVSESFNHMGQVLADADNERAILLAGVSHDLRTPITKLRLVMELSAADTAPDLQESADRQLDEMERVIGQFLAYARTASAEPVQCVDLAAFAEDLALNYRKDGVITNIPRDAALHGDIQPEAMRRSLINLIENAIRYGVKPIELRLIEVQDKVLIEVVDQGAGVPDDKVLTLIQPFERGRPGEISTTGAGLGLTIVERTVRAIGGTFELENLKPSGFCARIILPRTVTA